MKKLLFLTYYSFFNLRVLKFLRVKSKSALPQPAQGATSEDPLWVHYFPTPRNLKWSKAWTIHLERVSAKRSGYESNS